MEDEPTYDIEIIDDVVFILMWRVLIFVVAEPAHHRASSIAHASPSPDTPLLFVCGLGCCLVLAPAMSDSAGPEQAG